MAFDLNNVYSTRGSYNSTIGESVYPTFERNYLHYESTVDSNSVIGTQAYFDPLRDLPESDPRKIVVGDRISFAGAVTVTTPQDRLNYPNGTGVSTIRTVTLLYPHVLTGVV